jgi:ABC-type dipeptide/oligopeptide/nickel transport system permease subunit
MIMFVIGAVSAFIGVVVGSISGFYGKKVDAVFQKQRLIASIWS